ncbi:MAG TPA: hypothetical protein VMW12_03455 [Candidatus Dormibacteraeota bacterium]|nr:hypothetical protein [Candidatus Dormibacteraeota bacterium]
MNTRARKQTCGGGITATTFGGDIAKRAHKCGCEIPLGEIERIGLVARIRASASVSGIERIVSDCDEQLV